MKNKIKIFFIFQDISLTGAPIIFNKYLNIAKTENQLDITIFSRYNNLNPILIKDVHVLHKKLPKNLIHSFFFKIYDILYFTNFILIKRPKIIFTNSYINTTPIFLSIIFKIKTIVLVHENSGALIRFRNFRSFLIRKSNNIIAVSHSSYQFCKAQNIPINKLSIIRNGLDISDFNKREFNFNSKIIKLGAIANWSQYKRLDKVVEFFNELISKQSDYKFTLIIGGDCYLDYKTIFEKIKIANPHILFCGLVSENDKFYKDLDGYLFFSENESYPTVLLETLFYQIPVFSTSEIFSAKEVLQDALITGNSTNDLINIVLNFYTKNQKQNIFDWHINCINQLKNNNIINSWEQIYKLIINE